MKQTVEGAIKSLASKAGGGGKSEDAMRFSQAALNLAHTLSVHKEATK